MYHNLIYRDINEALPDLAARLGNSGLEVGSRNGRAKELTHVGITLTCPARRELLVQGRNPNLAAQVAETMWVLAGRHDIKWLGHYLPRAENFSDDGLTWRAGYGPRLRDWKGYGGVGFDQLAHVVNLLKENPLDRRAVISLWDPTVDTLPGKDIACNNWLSFSARLGRLDLHVGVRSNDLIWGWSGINAFEWSALQEVVATLVGHEVGSLHFSTTSLHMYEQHWNKAQRIVEHAAMTHPASPVRDSPRFDPEERSVSYLDELITEWFRLEADIRSGKMVEKEVDRFPEQMLQSWLRVLQWWWSSDRDYLDPLKGSALELASHFSVPPPEREAHVLLADDKPVATLYTTVNPELLPGMPSDFMAQLTKLHLEKEAAYGGSWKKRGEMLGIMANIARKVDRLEGGETDDETSADTAGDLLVYLAKYHTWLHEHVVGGQDLAGLSDHAQNANDVMTQMEREIEEEYQRGHFDVDEVAGSLAVDFEMLEQEVMANKADRHELVYSMMQDTYLIARKLWEQERKEQQARTAGRDAALRGHNGDDYRGADVD